MTANVITRLARAKINLTLHVTGQRDDGYHLLDSLVCFADIGDVLRVEAAAEPVC
jgi:4-diphosphocytidyl-2-C-methyl-D-erythritol kinase